MKFQNFGTLTTQARSITFILLSAALISLMTGCSAFSTIKQRTKEVVGGIGTPGKNLTKKVGIVLFENKTSIPVKAFEESFENFLLGTIDKECSGILFVKPGDAEYPEYLTELPRQTSGRIDNFALAQTGRHLGLNAIVTGAIVDISGSQEEKGILWFKSDRQFVQSQVTVSVYDIETGAKVLDESYLHKVEAEEADIESLGANIEINVMALNETFEEIADDMGEAVCDALGSLPWRGFLTSVKNDKIILSSGSRAGLKQGDILEVYDISNVFEGARGQRFFLPGKKTGEVKITAVSSDRAEAVIVSGDEIKPGSSVRPKK